MVELQAVEHHHFLLQERRLQDTEFSWECRTVGEGSSPSACQGEEEENGQLV